MLGTVGCVAGSGHGEFLRGDPQLPSLSVADHIECLGAEDGYPHEDAQTLGFSQEDVTAEAGKLLDLALAGATLGGDDFDGGVDGLNFVEARIDLSQEPA